ncbi:MAG: ATP-binding protein, partial [Adlercreutzia sp.]|nr:ATP-binding protein [Adlercreutzia sp.]
MDKRELARIIEHGETDRVEFKRCGNQPGSDLFETLCAFANSFGGDVFLGVNDDGTIVGLREDQVLPVTRNILNVLNNPNAFDIPVPVDFEQIDIDGRSIVKLAVPNSPQMHS